MVGYQVFKISKKEITMKLIDKEAVVAEIESEKNRAQILGDNAINGSMQQFYDGMKESCVKILSFLDTLEVKEVDLKKEIKKYIKDNICGYCVPGVEETAKHFFELGIKAQKGE